MPSKSLKVEDNSGRRYAVFLSYRHLDNKEPGRQWATWLHQALESYEIPRDLVGTRNAKGQSIPASLYPVFRDEEELPADADLTQNIRKALENSSLLVVICSPHAVESRFVAEEIRYFKELGKSDRILALMIDGEPNAAEDSGKTKVGISQDAECLPEPLRYGVPLADGAVDWNQRTEPVAADTRPDGRPEQGWTTGAAYVEALRATKSLSAQEIATRGREYEQRLELAKLKVVAGAIGVPLGVLTQRDKSMQLVRARQRARVLRRWLGAVAVLAVCASILGVIAWTQREQARVESERRRELLLEAAQSDRLRAEEYFERGDLPGGLAYLARAIRYDPNTTFAAEQVFAELNNWTFAPVTQIFSHDASVNNAHFSPDGKLVVTASDDKTAKIWVASTGRPIVVIKGHDAPITDALFTADGKRIVTIAAEPGSKSPPISEYYYNVKSIGVWEAETGKMVSSLPFFESAWEVQLDRFGRHLLSISKDGIMRVWDVATGACFATLTDVGSEEAKLSSDGERVIVRYYRQGVSLWDAHGRLLRKALGAEDAGFDADGRWTVCYYRDHAELWDSQSGQVVASVRIDPNDRTFAAAKFSRDGKLVVTTWSDGIARVSEADSGKAIVELPIAQPSDAKELKEYYTVEFSPGGQEALSVRRDGRTSIWDVRTGKLLAIVEGLAAHSANFSPDGRMILAFPEDAKVVPDLKIWNLSAALYSARTGKLLSQLQWPGRILEFSPDCASLLSTRDGVARLSRTFPQNILPEFVVDSLDKVQFSSDDSKVLTSGVKTTQLWDSSTGTLLKSFSYSGDARFCCGDQQIFLAGRDHVARVWNAITGNLRFTFSISGELGESPCVSDNGQRVVTLSGRHAEVRDLGTGDLVTTIELTNSGQKFRGWMPSADGKQLLDAFDQSVDLWDADTGTREQTLRHPAHVNQAAFSPDGTRVVTTCDDQILRVWDATTGQVLATLQPSTCGSQSVRGLGYSASGNHIFGDDDPHSLWDAQTYRFTGCLDGFMRGFSRDGERAITEGQDFADAIKGWFIKIWDTRSCSPVAQLRTKDGKVEAFSKRVIISHYWTADPDPEHAGLGNLQKSLRLNAILNAGTGPPPPWFIDLLHYLAQERLNARSELEPIPVSEWLEISDRLRKIRRDTTNMNTSYCELLRRFVPE